MDTIIVSPSSGIYKILNTKNGKQYIGSAANITFRWACHLSVLRSGKHNNTHLQKAWNKYGEESFVFIVLETCPIEDLLKREQSYLPEEKTVEALRRDGFYNISPIAGNTRGVVFTDARKQAISRKAIERMADPVVKKRMSIIQKERWANPAHREKSLSHQAKKIRMLTERNKKNWEDPAYREARAGSMRKLWEDKEFRADVSKKIQAKAKERMRDPELRQRVAEGMRKRWQDPEYRAKRAEVMARKRNSKSAGGLDG